MALQDIKSVSVSGDVADLIAQVDEAMKVLNQRRPFSPEVEARLRTLFLPDRVTATLNIEGITVTRRQTLAVMDAMTVSSYATHNDKEIFNILVADETVYDHADAQQPLTQHFIRQVNGLILKDLNSESGTYRTTDVTITGADFTPPFHGEVPALMQQICDEFPATEFVHPIIQSAWLHNQFTYVHPFIDGNGRTARLLQDYCLLKRRYYPVGVASHKRDDYYQALQLADGGVWDDLVELIALAELGVLAKIDAETREPERRHAWVSQIAKAASAKKTGAQHKQYLIWKERMLRLQSIFLSAARDIDESSDVVGTNFRVYDPIDFEKWKKIGSYGGADRTWAFSLLFFVDSTPFYKVIFYFRRHRSDTNDPHPEADGMIALAITGQDARSTDRLIFGNFNDPDIRLRELLYSQDELICYEQGDDNKLKLSDAAAAEDAIREFFEDIFYKKAGLAG